MNQKDTIQRTGQLMLRGWKLLALSCPVCNTALLSNKSSGEMLCPGCNLPVKDERTTVHSNIESMPPVDGHVNDEEEEEDSDSLFESSSRIVTYESTNNRLNNISGKLGEKLLKGWTMRAESCLDASCRGTPLMQESAGKPLLCVSCGEEYEIKDGHLYHVQAEPKSTPIQVVGTNNVNPTTPVVPVEVPASSAACSSHAIEVFPNVSAPTNSSNVWQTARVLLEKKLLSACHELGKNQSVLGSTDLATLIIKLTEALKAVGSGPN